MKNKKYQLALIGYMLITVGLIVYFFGLVISIPRNIFFFGDQQLHMINSFIVLYSGIGVQFGIILLILDIYILLPKIKKDNKIRLNTIDKPTCTVALMAYNEEDSIYSAVQDFNNHEKVKRVIVINNNSSDNTKLEAERAGAIVIDEKNQGYGYCFVRALLEASSYEDTSISVLCEGDMSFRAYDLDKMYAYIKHTDIVNGTRTVDRLQDGSSQLTAFINYGNIYAGKLLEMKYFGSCNLTDVGTTFKMCRNDALLEIIALLNPEKINHEMNPYFMDTALSKGYDIIECPITFHKRIGYSKGGNASSYEAFKLGIRMIWGISFGWWDR